MLSDGGSLSTIGLRIRLHGGQVAVCLGRMARGASTPCNFGAAFDTDSPLILISWPVPVMTPAGWRPRIRCCGARRNECATRCELRPAECEPVPHHAQDFNFTVVRAYKRSCEYVDSVIKIGRRSTFCAYDALTAGQPISAPSAITLI